MEQAPFHADLAEGPEGGYARWLAAEDGVQIRAGIWPGPDGARGTVFLFPGRCEYIEKYGRTAVALRERGYASLAIDWRGQGLSQRLLKNPDIGHVGRFLDYQLDVAAVLALAAAEDLPRPWYMIAHSMGGAIGLRSLIDGAPFSAAAFSAPMWGVLIAPKLRHLARTLPHIARRVGLGGRQTPTTNRADFFQTAPFEGNLLTTDREMWDYMKRQTAAVPRFRLGGPSLIWLGEALTETLALQRAEKPAVPAHVSVGDLEKIVDPDVVLRVARGWAGCTVTEVPGAEHELLVEAPEIRAGFLDRAEEAFGRGTST